MIYDDESIEMQLNKKLQTFHINMKLFTWIFAAVIPLNHVSANLVDKKKVSCRQEFKFAWNYGLNRIHYFHIKLQATMVLQAKSCSKAITVACDNYPIWNSYLVVGADIKEFECWRLNAHNLMYRNTTISLVLTHGLDKNLHLISKAELKWHQIRYLKTFD